MIPETHKNKYSISLIFAAFKIFLFWPTFCRVTLECCHSAGIPSSGSLFDVIFGICETCRCETIQSVFADDSGSYENEHSIFSIFEPGFLWRCFRTRFGSVAIRFDFLDNSTRALVNLVGMSKARPSLQLRNLDPPGITRLYAQINIKRICIHSWFYYYNFRQCAIDLNFIRKIIENSRGLHQ